MSNYEDVWVPLVDEPIGSIVAQLQAEDPEFARLISSPRRVLAFRTFAYIRVGMKLGELYVEHDLPPFDGSATWVELLLRDPAHRAAVAKVIRHVAEEIAADPRFADEDEFGLGEDARARFRDLARERLFS
ncbi:MAG: hypothetical protein WKF65_05675 [Gaiellaceae bacterium]